VSPGYSGSASIWSAALLAAGCTASRNGESRPVQWKSWRGRLYYRAKDAVVVRPLNVALQAGEVLEVRWDAGDTAYHLTIVHSQHTEKEVQSKCQPRNSKAV